MSGNRPEKNLIEGFFLGLIGLITLINPESNCIMKLDSTINQEPS